MPSMYENTVFPSKEDTPASPNVRDIVYIYKLKNNFLYRIFHILMKCIVF